MKQLHIAFVGGGTLGHITPLLAVMDACEKEAKKQDMLLRATYIGLAADMESPLIKNSELVFETRTIHSGKLHRHFTWEHVKQLKGFVRGIADAQTMIKQLQPDVIFAKGGYVTVPIALAAWHNKIPLYAHESDAVPGLANRVIGKYAKGIFTSYPTSVYAKLPQRKLRFTGQPVRKEFYEKGADLPVVEDRALDAKKPIITVFGGSQGARKINKLVAEIWEELAKSHQIVHITGPNEFEAYRELAEKQDYKKMIFTTPFIKEGLPGLFQKSDIVLSRSGGSVAELAASRACALLIPLSTSAQDHQRANARVLEEAGAARVLDEVELTANTLLKTIREILKDSREQTSLRASIGHFDRPYAAQDMADVLLGIKPF